MRGRVLERDCAGDWGNIRIGALPYFKWCALCSPAGWGSLSAFMDFGRSVPRYGLPYYWNSPPARVTKQADLTHDFSSCFPGVVRISWASSRHRLLRQVPRTKAPVKQVNVDATITNRVDIRRTLLTRSIVATLPLGCRRPPPERLTPTLRRTATSTPFPPCHK